MRADVFQHPPPQWADDEVLARLADDFGLSGTLVALDSERDQNFRLRSDHGDWVVKVANVAEDPAVLALQHSLLEHLQRVAPGLPVPQVRPTLGGEPLAVWDDERGAVHRVRCVSWLPGTPIAAAPRTAAVERHLGRTLGRLTAALVGFEHPAAHRPDFLWHLDGAQRCAAWLGDIASPDHRHLVERALQRHARRALPVLGQLPTAVVHHDANDFNVLVEADAVTGLIDFGDVVHGPRVYDLAVGLAYALLGQPDLVATTRNVVGGYVAEQHLTPQELQVLFDLVVARLAMSVAISSHRSRQFGDNEYLLVSQAPALALLGRLMAVRPEMWHAVARDAAGWEPAPRHDAIVAFVRSPQCRPAPVLPRALDELTLLPVSLAAGAPGSEHAGDPVAYEAWLRAEMEASGATVAVGAYGEDRSCYQGEQFRTDAPEPRSVHLGIDLFGAADTPVRAMLPGVVRSVADHDLPFDYGPTVVLEHQAGDAGPFWVLYGHLSRRTLQIVRPGQVVAAGEVVGFFGDHTVNGGWSPHVHVQIMTDLLLDDDGAFDGNFEGAGEPSRIRIWSSLVPDAGLLVR